MPEMNDSVLARLGRLIAEPEFLRQLSPILVRVEATLAASPEQPQAWEPLPLGIFDGVLLGGIQSGWVFVLRSGGTFGAERHPNSHQRTFALRGSAVFELFRNGAWARHPIQGRGEDSVPGSSVSIPAGVWHRIAIGPQNLVSLSFHTVPAEALIEETPVGEDLSVTKKRLYHAQVEQ